MFQLDMSYQVIFVDKNEKALWKLSVLDKETKAASPQKFFSKFSIVEDSKTIVEILAGIQTRNL